MTNEEKEVIKELKRTIKYSNYCDNIGTGQIEIVLNYIDKLQNKLASKQKQIKLMQQCDLAKELDKLQKENDELQADKNKLINYIAIRENKTHEEVCTEFEV